MMNKITALILSLICILSICNITTYAVENDAKIQTHTSDMIKNNQGFNIYFSFQNNPAQTLGAFRLQVFYDESHFSFMEAKLCTLDTDSHLIKANVQNGIVTLVFASQEALHYVTSQDIFFMRFKAIDTQSSESYGFQTTIMEIVDFDGNYLSISNPADFYINGSGSACTVSAVSSDFSENDTDNSAAADDNLFSTDNISSTENSSVISSTEGDTIILRDNRDADVKENNFPIFLLIIVGGVLIFAVAFYIGRKQRKPMSEEDYRIENPLKKKK